MNKSTEASMFVGRGAISAPPNRFESVWREVDHEQLAADDDLLAGERKLATTFAPDKAESLIRENNSPDVPFRFSLNAYRGCEHGCSYCKPYPFSASLGSLPIHPLRNDRNHFQRLDFRLMQGVRQ